MFSYRWSDLITLISKQVKHIPTQTVDALNCDWVSSRIAGRLPWKFLEQTIADGQIPLINFQQDYDPPFNIWRLTGAWLTSITSDVQQDVDLIIKESNAIDMFRRSPFNITSVALQAGIGKLRLSSAVIIPQYQAWELRGSYQINPVRVIDTSQLLWFDDRYVHVAIEGLTYVYYKLADDPRAGSTTGTWPGEISYSGQLAQFMSGIKEMTDAEDIGGDMQVFPDSPLGISASQYGYFTAFGIGGGGGGVIVPPTPAPTITSVSPSSGDLGGGMVAQITGSNFFSGAMVRFGSTLATNVVVVNSTTITCTVPPGVAGVVTVSVTSGGQTAMLPNGFTYIAPPAPPTISLASISLNPTWILGGNSSAGVVTLTAAAPAGGAIVTLSSSTNVVQVPAIVTVPEGATSATFTATTSVVGADVSGAITAAFGGTTHLATFIVGVVTDVSLVSITLNPTSVAAGGSVTGTATISGHTLGSGALVSLSSSNVNVAQVPTGGVEVLAGATTGDFPVTTSPGAANQTVVISGNYGNTQSASLNVTAPVVPQLVSISANPSAITGSGSSTITVTINMPAPAGGVVVALSYANYDNTLTFPSTMTIPAGQTSGSFTLNVGIIDMNANLLVEATYAGHGVMTTIVLTMVAAPIYAGMGPAGATGISVSGNNIVTLQPIGYTITEIKATPEVAGDSFGPFTPNGFNIYLLLNGGSRTFLDQNNNVFAMNPPTAVTFKSVPMYLYQSSQGLYMTWTVKVQS